MCGGGSGGQVEGPGDYERELVRIAEARLQEYDTTYKPLENQFLEDTQRLDTDWHRDAMADTAISTTRSQFNPYGVQAGTGETAIKTQLAGGSQVLAKAAAMAGGAGTQASEDVYTGRMLEYVGSGQQQAGLGLNMFGQAAGNQAGVRAAEAAADQVRSDSMYNAVGTAAGFGFGAAADKYDWFKPDEQSEPNPDNPFTYGAGSDNPFIG